MDPSPGFILASFRMISSYDLTHPKLNSGKKFFAPAFSLAV